MAKKGLPDMSVRLKALREAARLTQQELAERAGLSIALLHQLEQGRRVNPQLSTLIALAGALDMTPAQLVGELTRPAPKKGEKKK